MSINEQYEKILIPDELIKSFDTMACFENWCNEGSILDLTEALKVFETYELYEYCEVMNRVLKQKQNA